MIVAGLGCRLEASPDAMLDLVALAIAEWGLPEGFATPVFRQNHPAIHAVLDRFGLPLQVVDLLTLASVQPRCLTHSERARISVGFGSVAEGAALAALTAASTRTGRLLGPRIAGDGVTCAFAIAGREGTVFSGREAIL